MINLNAYDSVQIINKTWIDDKYKKLYSKVIPYKVFFTLLRRYNTKDKVYDYYLLISDKTDNAHVWDTAINNKTYVKYNIEPYWNILPTHKLRGVTEINIELVDSDDESQLYYLDI